MKTLRIEGVIGDMGNTAEEFNQRLDALGLEKDEELKLIVNSPGGSVFEGYSIFSKIKALDNRVTTKIEGLAASIASLIVLAGDKVEMSQVSMLMVHFASTMVQGNAEELQQNIDTLKTIDNTLISVYAMRTGKDKDIIRDMLAKETFIDSEEALADGWVDEVVDKVSEKMAAEFKQINKINNMGKLTEFFGLASPKVKASVEETPVAEVEEKASETKAEEVTETKAAIEIETPEELTIEAVNDRLNQLIMIVDELVENMDGDPMEEQAVVEQRVEAKFSELLESLPKTNGIVAQAVGSIDKVTKIEKPKQARFMARLKEIETKTRRK